MHVLLHVRVCVPTCACTESKRGNQAPCSILLYSLGLLLSLNPELGWSPASPRNLPISAPSTVLKLQAYSHVHLGARDLNSDPNGCAANSLISLIH